MSTAAQPATSGAARKARERKARAQAKHVRWLASSYQTLAAHHTGSSDVASLLAEVKQLKVTVTHLHAEVASLRSSTSAFQKPSQVMAMEGIVEAAAVVEVVHVPEVKQQENVQHQRVVEQVPVPRNLEEVVHVQKVMQPDSVQHQVVVQELRYEDRAAGVVEQEPLKFEVNRERRRGRQEALAAEATKYDCIAREAEKAVKAARTAILHRRVREDLRQTEEELAKDARMTAKRRGR